MGTASNGAIGVGGGSSRPGSAKGSAASPAPASAALPAGVEAELERLRDENKRLRMENGYLLSERDEKEKGMAVLQSFRTKMAGLQTQLHEAQQMLATEPTAAAAAAALAVDRPASAASGAASGKSTKGKARK